MSKHETKSRKIGIGVIPVVRAESSDIAMRAIDAIKEGGGWGVEITMTVAGEKSGSSFPETMSSSEQEQCLIARPRGLAFSRAPNSS